MAASGGVSMLRHHLADELAAEQHAEDDRADRQPFDPAVRLDELRGRQQLGEDAVLGRRVGRRTEADHCIGDQRVSAEQHHQAADHLDGVRDEHHAPFGHGIGKGAHQRREDHVEQCEHRRQRRHVPGRGTRGLEQFDGRHQQRVVSQRAEELRRHDGVETFFHADNDGLAGGVLAAALSVG
jgi:hypothetical protein